MFRRLLLLCGLPLVGFGAMRVELNVDRNVAPVAFAAAEIERAASATKQSDPLFVSIEVISVPGGDSQAYRIERTATDRLRVVGQGPQGAMYGGLDIAEAIRTGTVGASQTSDHKPHIAQRGIKFNLPLDLRTPSYTDSSDAAPPLQRALALEPPSVPVAGESAGVSRGRTQRNVWRTRAKLDDSFHLWGTDMVCPRMLNRKSGPGFSLNLHIKDHANALDTSHEVGAQLPLTAAVMEIMQTLKHDGCGDSDHGAIVRYFEKLAKIEIKRPASG